MKSLVIVKAVLLLLSELICLSTQNELIIDTTSGQVEGIEIKTVDGITVNGFLGIPFAEPPVGNLRFKPPVKNTRSTGTIKANERSKSCLQALRMVDVDEFDKEWLPSIETTSEDCLYLNIWVPSPRPKDAAVMVWIHGGGYEAGTANSLIYDGKILASKGVIVVSMNYRLTIFGFLMVDKIEAPGNVGLMDQALALKWVQENIANFGGSPEKVTIFGESAGAGSVGHHLLLPSSQGLFQKAVLQSGAASSVWSFSSKKVGSYVAGKYIETAGCLSTTPKDMVHCLREKTVDELIGFAKTVSVGSMVIAFNPIVDGEYYPEDPNVLLAQRKLNKNIDILLGAQDDDGLLMPVMAKVLPITEDAFIDEETFTKYIAGITSSTNDLLVDIIKFHYTDFDDEEQTGNWRRSITDFATDLFFKCSMNTLAESASENGNNVFYYQFNHKVSFSKMPSWAGATHGDEIPFVFGAPLVRKDMFTAEEEVLKEKIMTYWTEFAKKGDPNSENTNPKWPRYTSVNKDVFTLNLTDGLQRGMRAQTCAFLNNILPRLIQKLEGTK